VGGHKNQVRKWASFWEQDIKVDVIIFVVALDECFNKGENEDVNGLEDSLRYWRETTHLQKLSGVPFILLLNKLDRFQHIINSKDIQKPIVPDNDYLWYIVKQFRQNFGGCVMYEYEVSAIKVQDLIDKFAIFLRFF